MTDTSGITSSLTWEPTSNTGRWAEDQQSGANVSGSSSCGTMFINSHFDSGNVEIVDISDPSNIQLAIHRDPFCETDQKAHFQWFHFRVTGVRSTPLTLHMVNAGEASYPNAWEGYSACASYDLSHWFRVPTAYDKASGALTITHTPEKDAVHYAYFAPYSLERHAQLVHRMQCKDRVRLHMIGETLDGHDMDLLQVGEHGEGKRVVWVIARQHPGESMAEWFAEGLLERLTDPHDATSRALLDKAVFYVVPNMNPDGSWRGHLRVNAQGSNLNRCWAAPTLAASPEVHHTLAKMAQTGVDMMVDVHGDEELPYVFIAGNAGIPEWSAVQNDLQNSFLNAFKRASPEFQTKFGYAEDKPGQANLTLASKAVGARFGCLAVTLEMPFKDATGLPEPLQGWSPERSSRLGAAMLGAVLEVLPALRP
ncbi:MAG: hypothetical protein WDW36_008735 [Sanguina aurantia]